ncbi:MAG: Glutathione transport system permease protein GsiD [Firmicutes bacterium ADurb.Bin248]|nr:MAG: Glutathione transport system permease protein GsiD [Firmicutes bacterium ADurb.Bin248]HOG01508.1 ABC transporter permease [Clostridia bacterium]
MKGNPASVKSKTKARGMWAEVWRNYRKSFGAMLGLCIVGAIVLIAVAGNFYFDYEKDVVGQNIAQRLQPPSPEHWFGTDEYGRDIFARVVWGARYSLSIGFAAVLVSCLAGVVLGAVAGYYGGVAETVIMRLADIFMSVPSILLGICLVSAFGQSVSMLVVAVSIGAIPAITRVARASVMTVRDMEFVEAARAAGANDLVIIFRHVLMNALAPVIVQATLRISGTIIAIAALSFIGLGITAPTPEWGTMLASARGYIRGYSYMTLFSGLAIMITVMGFNLIGDGVRDSFDPKLKK